MIIGNYTIKQKLGEGGMATVYLAEHNILKQPVAIKILKEEYVFNENIRKRFLSEAKNMFKMTHPNIIKVTDLIDQEDGVAFVMEYIEGETLKEHLERKGKLTDEEIKKLFVQMLESVSYVHEQNLVHRDIKPSNFMISPKGVVKLLDFGIAKNTDKTSAEYTQTGTMQNMGTPMYMSPEQIKSTKDVTGQSDIYSLGVVLWQIVMGQKPYNTNTSSTFELQSKIVNENLPKTNTNFDEIIEKATSKNLAGRFQNCGQIIASLGAVNKINIPISSQVETMISDNEKTIIADGIQNDLLQLTSRDPNKNTPNPKPLPPKKTNLFLVIGIPVIAFLLIIGVIFFIKSGGGEEAKAYSESSSSSSDVVSVPSVDTTAAAMPDYYKAIQFTNNTSDAIDLAIAYWDSDNASYVARGWQVVQPGSTISFTNINVSEGDQVYWYGKTYYDISSYSGVTSNNQFCLNIDEDFNFPNASDCGDLDKYDFNEITINGNTTTYEIYSRTEKK